MTRDEWIKAAENDFFDVVVQGGSLDDLSERAYKYLKNPIMVTNERGLIFGKAKSNPPYYDSLFEEFHEKGYVPREKFLLTSAEIFAGKIRHGSVVILEKAYIAHRLMLYQDNVGPDFIFRTILLESKKPFENIDEAVFALFARTVGYLLLNSTAVRCFRSNTAEYFFYETLMGHIDSLKNEDDVSEYLGIVARDRVSLLVVTNMYGSFIPVHLDQARKDIEAVFPGCISIIDGSYVVLLIRNDEPAEVGKYLRRAEAYIRQNDLKGCISRVFDSLRYIAENYRDIKALVKIGAELCSDVCLFYQSDMISYGICGKLDKESLNTNCFLPIFDLLECDKSEGTDYLPSLYAYALTFGSCTRAAKLLGVHYNTMKTRLDKAEKILGVGSNSMLPAIYSSIVILVLLKLDTAGKYLMLEKLNREMLLDEGE